MSAPNTTIPLVLKARSIVYEKHKRPQLVHYEEVVADLKTKESISGEYTKRQVHASVRRALLKLESIGEIIRDGKCFYGLEEYEDYIGKENFKKYVIPSLPRAEIVNINTYAVKLESAQDHEMINKAVLGYLGKERLYASFVCDNVLIIILDSSRNCIDGAEDLRKMIEDAYLYHNKKFSDL